MVSHMYVVASKCCWNHFITFVSVVMVSHMYVVASKCCWNHFISEKYKTVQSFKLHFLKETSASDCKGVGNFPRRIAVYISLITVFLMQHVL